MCPALPRAEAVKHHLGPACGPACQASAGTTQRARTFVVVDLLPNLALWDQGGAQSAPPGRARLPLRSRRPGPHAAPHDSQVLRASYVPDSCWLTRSVLALVGAWVVVVARQRVLHQREPGRFSITLAGCVT